MSTSAGIVVLLDELERQAGAGDLDVLIPAVSDIERASSRLSSA